MQAPTAAPRTDLTTEQVVNLIEASTSLTIGRGAELLDMNLNVVEDISPDLLGGQVSRSSYANLHGTCQLAVTRELDWGSAIVRPYMTMTDGTTTARFNLGAYFTNVPKRDLEETPPTYDVAGHDILHALSFPVGEAYAVESGSTYLAAVEAILVQQGYTQYLIDQTSADIVLPTDRVWPFEDSTKWLTVVNDLLASLGYAGIWSDWDGRLRCQPYQPPRERAPEWLYAVDSATSMLSNKRSVERDYFEAPNRWVFYRSNAVDDLPPVEGNGIYTYTNQSDGDTSVDARGRVITRTEGVDVADHAALVAQAELRIDADLRLKTSLSLSTAPNPLHWHFDRLVIADPGLGPSMDVLDTSWTLPLDGGDMTHEMVSL